ncbi:MAG: polymer-forming cytoskeletal protein [Candidatus Zixiibacteriota bacterium]
MKSTHSPYRLFLFAAILIPLITAGSIGAITFEKEDNIHISNLHRIDDDLIAWGSVITVDGLIEGDLIAGAYTVNTNGHIRGSQNVFAYTFTHAGKVDGALRAFVNRIDVNGYVGRSMMVSGQEIHVGEKTVIEKDAVLLGGSVYFDGMAREDVEITAGAVYISGVIHGNVVLKAENINILPPAFIEGNLTYYSENEAFIDEASGVTIVGETVWEPKEADADKDKVGLFTQSVVGISKLLAAFLFGVVLLLLFKRYAAESIKQLKTNFAVSTATGLLAMIIFAISVIILMISGILVITGLALVYSSDGSPAGGLVLALSIFMVPITSFMTVSGGVLFYSGKIVFALLIGYALMKMMKPGAVYLGRFQMLLGLAILAVLCAVPYVGFIVYLVISIIGAGAIILGVKNCRKDSEAPATLSAPPEPPGETG